MTKRFILLSIMLILTTIFSAGCLEVNINVGIDERYNSFLEYEIAMDIADVDPQYHKILGSAVNSLGWHYQEQYGFLVGVNTDTEIYTLTMKKSVPNDSFPQAYRSLEGMLTDEDVSTFMLVDMTLENLPHVDSYVMGAMLDTEHIAGMSNIEEMPPDVQDEFHKGLAGSSGIITLTLPVSEVFGYSHEYEHLYRTAIMQIPIDFNSQTEFDFRGSVIYSDGDMTLDTFEVISDNIEQLKTMLFIAAGAILALLLIIMIAVLVRVHRQNKIFE